MVRATLVWHHAVDDDARGTRGQSWQHIRGMVGAGKLLDQAVYRNATPIAMLKSVSAVYTLGIMRDDHERPANSGDRVVGGEAHNLWRLCCHAMRRRGGEDRAFLG